MKVRTCQHLLPRRRRWPQGKVSCHESAPPGQTPPPHILGSRHLPGAVSPPRAAWAAPQQGRGRSCLSTILPNVTSSRSLILPLNAVPFNISQEGATRRLPQACACPASTGLTPSAHCSSSSRAHGRAPAPLAASPDSHWAPGVLGASATGAARSLGSLRSPGVQVQLVREARGRPSKPSTRVLPAEPGPRFLPSTPLRRPNICVTPSKVLALAEGAWSRAGRPGCHLLTGQSLQRAQAGARAWQRSQRCRGGDSRRRTPPGAGVQPRQSLPCL